MTENNNSNLDPEKLKKQIADAAGKARGMVQENMENLVNGPAGTKFNELKDKYAMLPKKLQYIYGACAAGGLLLLAIVLKALFFDGSPEKAIQGAWICQANGQTATIVLHDQKITLSSKTGNEAGYFSINRIEGDQLYITFREKDSETSTDELLFTLLNNNELSIANLKKDSGDPLIVCKRQ